MDQDRFAQLVESYAAERDPSALVARYSTLVREYGATGFTAADFSIESRSDLLLYTDRPEIFLGLDAESSWWADDPVVARLAAGERQPFRMEDAWADPLPSAAPRWTVLVENGMDSGIVFPAPRPDYIGGVNTFADRDPETRARHLRTAPSLHLLTIYFHHFMVDLDPEPNGAEIVRNTLRNRETAGRRYKLAPREITCLRWCALGKTADEIARIEGLSVHTVRGYLKSAMQKMDAQSQAQAVARAMKYGAVRI